MAATVLIPILVATLGPLQFGFHLSELNAVQNAITCPSVAPHGLVDCITFDIESWALTQAIFTIGGFLGALLLGGRLIQRFGHREALVYTACILMLGSIAEAVAINQLTLAAGRCIAGIGAGSATVVSPVFVAAVAPKERRGFFGALTQVMINLGIFVGLAVGSAFGSNQHWRLALGCGALPALIMLVGITSSPRRFEPANDQAQTITNPELQPLLSKFGQDATTKQIPVITDAPIAVDSDLIATRHVSQPSLSIFELLRDSRHSSAAVAATAAMIAQQLTGINSVTMYSVSILEGSISVDAGMIALMVAGINVVATALFAPLPDMIGRKPCLIISAITMGMSSLALATGLSYDVSWLSITGMFSLVCGFSVGLGSVPFILCTELPQEEAVGTTSSLALAGSWLSSFLVAQIFPLLNATMARGHVYWIFAGIAFTFTCFAAWYIPETKQAPNEEEL